MSSASVAPKNISSSLMGSLLTRSGRTSKRRTRRRVKHSPKWQKADKADIDKAVGAARRAFEGKWSKLSARDRGRLLYKLSQLIEQHSRILRLWKLPTTASRSKSRFTSTCRKWSKTSSTSPVGPPRSKAKRSRSRQDVQLHLARADRCLWSDHSVELSFADGGVEARSRFGGGEYSRSQTCGADSGAMELAKLIQEAGFPEGVVNIVPGYGETAGASLLIRESTRSLSPVRLKSAK